MSDPLLSNSTEEFREEERRHRNRIPEGEVASMLEAHAEGLHDDLPREFCPECDDRRNRT